MACAMGATIKRDIRIDPQAHLPARPEKGSAMTNAVRAILFALCGSSLFFGPSATADQRGEVKDRQGRVVRVQRAGQVHAKEVPLVV